jgi:glycolate oxidase FAD binding subunit
LASQELRGLRGWSGELAAGAGSGELWQCAEQPSANQQPSAHHQVQALRRKLSTLGGQLSVLLQPDAGNAELALPAWLDAPSKPLIEAVKREFDPLQQLSRGRLPGVAQPFLS